jgi:Rrf2 family protein
MRIGEGVEWALHCVALAAQTDAPIRRETFARHYGLPEAYLGKHLQMLVRAGVLVASPGPRGGYRLARAPERITVLEVVEAIEGSARPFRCQEIRTRVENVTPAECRRPCTIDAMMVRAHNAWRASLRDSSISDIVRRTPASVRQRNAAWLAAAAAS